MIILTLVLVNVILAALYNVIPALSLPVVFVIATALSDCYEKSYLSPLLIGAIFIVSVGEMNLMYMLISIPVVLFDMISLGVKQIEAEEDYIWNMNHGPSSMERLKMIKGDDGKVELYSWVGGVNGYYQGSDKKYDRNMKEIFEK